MTRVRKSAFNVREKLTELGRRFGLKGTELARAETVQDARDLVSAGRRNLIINGDMRISQRLGSSGENDLTSTADGFGVDRFRSWQAGGGELKLQQSTNAPPGFTNSLLNTVNTADTSVAAGDYYTIQQRIEGLNTHQLNWGTSYAKDVTLSFWVRSTVSGVYSVSLWRDNQSYNYVTSYTINIANTWEYKTITIPGPIGGTWATNSGTGIGIWWDLGSGTDFSTATTETWGQNNKFRVPSQTSWIGTGSAEFRLTGVQLEVGKNATEFEHRNYGEELTLCQRYYQELPQNADHVMWGFGRAENNDARVQIPLSTPLRNSPNVTASNFRVCSVDGTHLLSTTAPTVYQWSANFASIIIDFPSGGSLSHNHVYIVTSNGGTTGLQMDSEL
jgi:hypothetical protein